MVMYLLSITILMRIYQVPVLNSVGVESSHYHLFCSYVQLIFVPHQAVTSPVILTHRSKSASLAVPVYVGACVVSPCQHGRLVPRYYDMALYYKNDCVKSDSAGDRLSLLKC